jgi:ABC-type glycerol-3-phosphate transport system substrate-binding protein
MILSGLPGPKSFTLRYDGAVSSTLAITRRVALGGAVAAAAGVLLWPYTPKSRQGVPRGRVEISYWEKWPGIEGLALQKVVDRFNATQDRIWVHLVAVGDIAAKSMVAIGGGDPPDLVGLYTYNVPGYAEAKAAIPLDEFASLGGIDPSAYAPAIKDLLWYEGRQWAGVNTCYTLGLYYNRALFRKASLDPTKPPRTIPELDDAAARLTRKDAQGRIEQAGFLQNVPGWWPYFWPTCFGGSLYSESTRRATCADSACVASFDWARATAAKYGIPETRSFAAGFGRSIHSAQDPFISGRMAMIVQGPWLANFIRSLRPGLDYACAPVSVAPEVLDPDHPRGLLEADILIIPRGCRHPKEAYQFLRFMQTQEVQEELAIAHCKPSPFLRMSPGFMEHHPHPSIAVFDAIAKSPHVQVLPRTPAWKQYSDLLTSAFDSVWGGADAAAVLAGVQTQAQALIDSAAAMRQKRERA